MNTILITGGAGFIGANFVRYWLDNHKAYRVVVLDALTYAGDIKNLAEVQGHPHFNFVQGNINDVALVSALLKKYQVNMLVNFAAETHVDRSIAGPDLFIETNIVGTHTLLKTCYAYWQKNPEQLTRFHHVSTDEVYGSLNFTDPPFTESSPYLPNSPYSASKAAADHLCRAYFHTYQLPITVSHCSNNYGPLQHREKLIPLLITHALSGKTLPIYGDGKNVRDWLHVSDHCRAIDNILHQGVVGETYNIGGANEQDNTTIVHLIGVAIEKIFHADKALICRYPACFASAGKPIKQSIQYVADRVGHDRRYAINFDKLKTALGYEPSVDFETGLQSTILHYINEGKNL